jgi:hypothetical protein
MLITEAIAISKSVSRAPKMNLGTSYSIQQEILKSLPIKCFSSNKLMTYIVYMLDLQLLAYLCIYFGIRQALHYNYIPTMLLISNIETFQFYRDVLIVL